jgi:2',3'-cyclic-nucleotide 2'-phosphodiesterase/3'-nucleotidase
VPSYGTIYNYDVFYAENNALTYQIDVTKPAGSRIVNLSYNGKAVADGDDFIVATNDYRAGGGGAVPGIDGSKTIIKSPDANQTVVSNYLTALGTASGKVTLAGNGSARSWSFVKVATAGPVILRSAPGHLALAKSSGISGHGRRQPGRQRLCQVRHRPEQVSTMRSTLPGAGLSRAGVGVAAAARCSRRSRPRRRSK